MSHKFRASFSVLHLWSKGLTDEAVRSYFKLDREVTEAMRQGSALHKEWADYIQANSQLPEVFGEMSLYKPQVEVKMTATLEGQDWIELVGIPDCYSINKSLEVVLEEFKSGTTSSQTYARSMQVPFYALLLAQNDVFISRAVIRHYNQYTKKTDTSYIWITDAVLEKAENWILTLAEEMHLYLESEGLYDLYSLPDMDEELEIELPEEEEEENELV